MGLSLLEVEYGRGDLCGVPAFLVDRVYIIKVFLQYLSVFIAF